MNKINFQTAFIGLVGILVVVLALSSWLLGGGSDPFADVLDEDGVISEQELQDIRTEVPNINLRDARVDYVNGGNNLQPPNYVDLDQNLPTWQGTFAGYKLDRDGINYLFLSDQGRNDPQLAYFLAQYSIPLNDARITIMTFDDPRINDLLPEGV